MSSEDLFTSVDAETGVATIEIVRPPHNFLDTGLLRQITAALHELDDREECRVTVLRSRGKNFCAGRDFNAPRGTGDQSADVYAEAARLVDTRKPWIAEVQGAAIGAGLGLAMAADHRMAGERAYFSANFVTLGLHHGFGLSLTLPRVVGTQSAADLLTTGRKVGAREAAAMGLVDAVVADDELGDATMVFAASIAAAPTEAVQAIRSTLRGDDFADRFRCTTDHESAEQNRLRALRNTCRSEQA
jgi:2-(1,2-epoxy-1,2-dihydrophenyl)acetyl-CoA isomerase